MARKQGDIENMIPRTINLLLAFLLISIAGIPVITAVHEQTIKAHEQTNVVDELPMDMEATCATNASLSHS